MPADTSASFAQIIADLGHEPENPPAPPPLLPNRKDSLNISLQASKSLHGRVARIEKHDAPAPRAKQDWQGNSVLISPIGEKLAKPVARNTAWETPLDNNDPEQAREYFPKVIK